MSQQSKIACYTAWANMRCSSLDRPLNNVFTDLFAGTHLKSLLEGFIGKSSKNMRSMTCCHSSRQVAAQFELLLVELRAAGILPENSEIDCGTIAKKNTKRIMELLWRLIVHDIQFTWERSSQLLLDNDKLVCSVCFKWTPKVQSLDQEKSIQETKTPLSFFDELEISTDSTEKSSISSVIKSLQSQDFEPFPGREVAKIFNKKIPKEGWDYYPSGVECILDLVNAHLQIASEGHKLLIKDLSDLVDSHVWCYLVNSFMPGTFIVEMLPCDRWITNLALKTMEEFICTSTSFTSQDLLEVDSKALCTYMCFIFMSGYKFKQSRAVTNCIRELHLLTNKLQSQLKTFTAKGLESVQSTQKSELQEKLEKIKNELSWLHASYDVPFCQNWSELAYKVQKKTKESISRKLIELFETVVVPRNMSMNELCLSLAIAFTQTNCFYLATEKETFPESRKIVLQDKKTKKFVEDFSGYQRNVSVRRILKLPLTGVVEVNPNAYPDYHLFFESKTRNKKLKMNMCVLYQVFPGSPGYWQRAFLQAVKNGDFQVVKNMAQFFKDSCIDVIHSKESGSGNGSLHLACQKGHFDITHELLENGVSLDARNANGLTPFFFAAGRQHRKICQLLIEWGCDVQAKDLKNRTAFDGIRSEKFRKFLLSYYAYWSSAIPSIILGHTDILEDIVHNHLTNMSFMSSPRSRCINGSTLLHTAAYFGKTDIIETLLQLKVDINLLDYKGAIPLHRSRDTETMQLMIHHGADVNRADVDGNTPLHVICFGEMKKPARLDCVEILLSHKAAIDRWNNKELLPIHCAAMQGRIDVIELLQKFDSEEQMASKLMKGSAPSLLYISLANNHIECTRWLSDKGFTFNAEEQEEMMFGLLHDEMKMSEKLESLELLIKNGVNINALDKHGNSALHLAAVKVSCNELLTLLLSNNAKVDALNRDHCTPLFFAVQTSNYYGASLLIKHGADIEQKNNQGVSAFDLIQDYHEWIESGCFTEEIIVLLKAYEIKQACSLVQNINRKLKMEEASQQSSIKQLRQASLSQPCFWVQT
ncbi:uncharacterized protein LOC125460951 isoform X2 [Stegostoma tigrinum]|uniref:uncharacterized protein LOC125460951 isoform X2 n=1 Tax=Stegostoma tigrinum TaxID=3053191 RepID=UPI00202B5025|nr:uncharacterized protein LOC125460951 isoform X2 [Stegostoma tigrinum]